MSSRPESRAIAHMVAPSAASARNALAKPTAPATHDRSFAVQLCHDTSNIVGVYSLRRSESQKHTLSLLETTDEGSVALCNTWVILV
jgi:hypothetical protein